MLEPMVVSTFFASSTAPKLQADELSEYDKPPFECISEKFLHLVDEVNNRLESFRIPSSVASIYNPTLYARYTFNKYVRTYCNTEKPVMYFGMNPGPWGMSQTGVPFGEVSYVRDWLKIAGPVGKPENEISARPVRGFDCPRTEVSGKRFWGFIKQLCTTPEEFFRTSFVYNYLPQQWLKANGCNVTPSDFKMTEMKELYDICDPMFVKVLEIYEVVTIVAIGKFCETRAEKALKKYMPHKQVKNLPWSEFGYSEKSAADTTLWVGSEGAHTPCHQDTYGFNIVAQLYGKKRWLLFPPDTVCLKPTRVPYEESSIYSDMNFYCPNNIDRLQDVSGCHMVELAIGDALLVPRGWWHYVQNIDKINISINIWLPHEKDDSTHVSEALTRIVVAQICKDLPSETAKLLVNPNEDDLPDTPLTVLFLQLDTVVNTLLDKKRKSRRSKRQKLNDDPDPPEPQEKVDVRHILENLDEYNIEHAKSITTDELVSIVKDNINRYVSKEVSQEDETDGSTQSLCLPRALIDAFSDNKVIELVKQNLIQRLSV